MSNYRIVGKKVKETVYNEKLLSFTLDDNSKIEYEPVGDCCSQSFIEDIDDLEALQNCEILSLDIERGESKEFENKFSWVEDVHKWTFYKFKTTKGYATLSFRNESNGYYDGELVIAGTGQYSGEY